jgi:hypothetical protein
MKENRSSTACGGAPGQPFLQNNLFIQDKQPINFVKEPPGEDLWGVEAFSRRIFLEFCNPGGYRKMGYFCHPERSEWSQLFGMDGFLASLRMTIKGRPGF